MKTKTKKGKRVYHITDLSHDDLDLLKTSYFIHYNGADNQFVCFGQTFWKMLQLGLVDEENKITFQGRRLVKYMMYHMDQQ